MRDASECLAALARASDATKYAATSIGSASRTSVVMSRSTGIAERCASARNAGPRPPLERIAGWIPREISCRSSTAATNPVATPDSCVAEVVPLRGKVRLRRAHRQAERDEPLLRAVVEVALDPPARLVRCGDDASARRRELGLAFRVRDRGRDELGELLQSLLGVGGSSLDARHAITAPQRRPSTMIGLATVETMPRRASIVGQLRRDLSAALNHADRASGFG